MTSAQSSNVRMTGQDVEGFLSSHWAMVLGTIDRGGFPHLTNNAYGLLDGDPVMTSYRAAQKVVNLQRDPRASCLIEDVGGYSAIKGVLLRGRAELIDDPADKRMIREFIINQMERATGVEVEAEKREGALSKRIAIRLRVEHVVSWDFSNVRPAP